MITADAIFQRDIARDGVDGRRGEARLFRIAER